MARRRSGARGGARARPAEDPRGAAAANGSEAEGAPARRLPLWGAAVLLVQLALMLAVFNPLAHNGGDTAGYVTLAHSLLEAGTYSDLWHPAQPPHTKYPPVFPALLAAAILLGARTWAALKVVPALFTTLSVLAVYLWARDRRGAPFAAAVALLCAGCHAVLWASHWELSEPPFMAFTFLSLWAYDRVGRGGALPWLGGKGRAAEGTADSALASPPQDRATASSPLAARWLVLGGMLAGLAYFTRSAGLPLVVAAILWLAFARRTLAAFGVLVGVGLPALLWSLRGGQGAQYVSEFWMVDPYRPDLGRVGMGGLLGRVAENTVGYVTVHVPVGLLGARLAMGALVGITLFVLAAWAWTRRLRGRPGVTELFLPMYLGVILLWPQVWSGDRFALPLIPILLFYAGERLAELTGRIQPLARRGVLAVAVLIIAIPASASWTREMDVASRCGALVRREGAFACWGPRMQEFVDAAVWAGVNLPEDAVVLARKPRIFYVTSGISSEVFPFTQDADRFLGTADSLGAGYVLMDHLDGTALAYVGNALYRKGGAFCGLEVFGGAGRGAPPTQLLGILPPEERGVAETEETGQGVVSVTLAQCPAEMTRSAELVDPPPHTQQIPLLVGFD